MTSHQRHTIRLQKLDYSLPNQFFITICCHHHGCYFDKYPQLQLIVQKQIVLIEKHFPNVAINSAIVMPNHLHLVLSIIFQVENLTLGKIIRAFKARVVVEWLDYIQKNHLNALARIWQRNYYEHRIRNRSEFLKFTKYIHFNPSNWNTDRYNPQNFKGFKKL